MQDYKLTLNLPETAFPMKANLGDKEPAILKRWEEQDLYGLLRQQGQGRPKFILHDGPPYANGQLHVGHVQNKVLKDIVVKSKTLCGYDAPFVPGWDCHGLPIELNVEKTVGKAGFKISAKEFRQKCREYAAGQIVQQLEDFKRLGVFGDWQHPYKSMDFKFEANVIRSLAKIVGNGHIQQGRKPVHWCIDCASALAEAEVEYQDKISPAIDVRFSVVDKAAVLKQFDVKLKQDLPVSVIIWTTTPWTLPANQAVTLSDELIYVLVETQTENGAECFIILESLLTLCMDRYGLKDYHVHGQCAGKMLKGLNLQHPFYDKQVPIILGAHVTTDAGTGCVHTAPAHGQDDYKVGLQNNLPLDNPVGQNGCYKADVALFAGLHVLKANQAVIDVLKEKHALLHLAELNHSYPHCWRHKTPLVFLATPQWFISMEQKQLRAQSLSAIKDVQWVPGWGEARIAGLIEQRPDWCISRQRAWGVPIPFILHKDTSELHPKTLELMEQVAKLVEKDGIDAWFDCPLETLIGDEAKDYYKLNDVLDVWFDSGVTHACVLQQNKDLAFPADLYLEGSDQHRGWFQSSLLSSVAMNGVSPYKAVLTHGYTVDAQGRKMSKSIGNIISAEKGIKNFGAEILRLWTAASDYHNEVKVSEETFKRLGDVYRRIRNTLRFLLANINGFDPSTDQVPPEDMLALDRYIVDKARVLQVEIMALYHSYEFHVICQKIHNFCALDLGSFYLDIIKDRQYTTQADSLARRSAQTAMYHILEAMTRWIAPILSFTAEELWQYIPGKREPSVFLSGWYQHIAALPVDTLWGPEFWAQVSQVRVAVNKVLEDLRNQNVLGAPLEAEVTLYCAPELLDTLDQLQDELRFVLITSSAEVLPIAQASVDTVKTDLPGLVLKVVASTYPKCVRCWHRRPDIGGHVGHPELCARCVENVVGAGEKRAFA